MILQEKYKLHCLLVILLTILPVSLEAQEKRKQETKVMVRVHSKDAKFIGSSIGGARIIIKEEETGRILAEGITRGSTGDTEKIMNEPRTRGTVLSDEDTAGFLANLTTDEPVFVTVEAIAPANKKQAHVKSSTQLWIIPGKDILGDGVVLEVPGFVIDILSPQTHERIQSGRTVDITANVVMMCGCPVTSGGIWDADNYEVAAVIKKEGIEVKTIDLHVAEKPSTFIGETDLKKGNYEILIYAYDPVTGNTGVDKTNILIQ